jgi:hypothetical protein
LIIPKSEAKLKISPEVINFLYNNVYFTVV